ncbi:hypothetical protein GNY06_09050 [Elizabethkingia argentiflava]|uniref:DUF4926 domain-containing protein n=1 Tax=Elizabethkingia argenteiflava TaxID=2681556 RepID=A0A845PTF0_9FLAO|nr:DUF4926 domain-containing protein [Elizabethkingia argenteiflava]NAW51519.1 hypothetical protein [Elizabethkingia argenteiflava]
MNDLNENDVIISTNHINENILKGTLGVVLNVFEENKYFLVEFIGDDGNPMQEGVQKVNVNDIAKLTNPPMKKEYKRFISMILGKS